MPKKKEPKVARIRYQMADPTKPNTIAELEGFYFEAWTPTGDGMPYGWSTICFSELRKSADFPDAPEKEFIHYSILSRISEWVRMGYTVYYGIRETADLDEREKKEWAEYNAKKKKSKS